MKASVKSPLVPVTDEAREIAINLLRNARFGALGVIQPDTGVPFVSRIAVGQAPDGGIISLISNLSQHTQALMGNPVCSLLIGEPSPKGDPLTHPRLTIQATASIIPHDNPEYKTLRDHYLLSHPKAQLYIDFADFMFLRFSISEAFLNGGFGFACMLNADDLDPK